MSFSRQETLDFIAGHCAEMLKLAKEADFKTLAYIFAMADQEAKTVQKAIKASGATTVFEAIQKGTLMQLAASPPRMPIRKAQPSAQSHIGS